MSDVFEWKIQRPRGKIDVDDHSSLRLAPFAPADCYTSLVDSLQSSWPMQMRFSPDCHKKDCGLWRCSPVRWNVEINDVDLDGKSEECWDI